MRRILLVGDYPPPWGGLSTQIAGLRSRLLTLGDEVVVLDIGRHRRAPRPECLPARGAASFARTLVAHARRGFTVHLHTNGHNVKSWMAAGIAAASGLGSGRRTVLTLGSGLMPSFLAGARGPLRRLVHATLRAAGGCIVRNAAAREAVIALGTAPAKVRVIPGFYGVTPREVGRVPLPAARFRRGHRPLIGMIASPGPEYGLALLIDAAAHLRPRHPELGVLLIGPDRLVDGHPTWALPLGELERPGVLAVMRTLDVFVRPTYFDGDASSVREALATGVRVVASDTAVRPAGVRTFRRGDADALAASIGAALQEPPTRVLSTFLPALLEVYDALPLGRMPVASRVGDAADPADSAPEDTPAVRTVSEEPRVA